MKYEKPEVIDFKWAEAMGLCSTGSGDGGICYTNGNAALTSCISNGNTASGVCTNNGNAIVP